MLVNFVAIRSSLLPFHIIYGHLVYFVVFGKLCGHFGVFSPVLASGNPGVRNFFLPCFVCKSFLAKTITKQNRSEDSFLSQSTSGLPDGLFSNQKSQFG
jgi:hypothetical protein